ncbi:MAG: N-6 DNA methylase [Bdellovibrionales bacterium]|nr:N-6 DNA methylase [Bdellovibrionales bacterium]
MLKNSVIHYVFETAHEGISITMTQQRFDRFQSAAYAHLRESFSAEFLDTHPLFYGPPTSFKNQDNSETNTLDRIFESSYCLPLSNRAGAVFTPPKLAHELVTELGDFSSKNLRILDPACGGGTLLALVLERLLPQLSRSADDAISFLKSSIFGIDRNPVAVEVTRLYLLTTLLRTYPNDMEFLVRTFRSWRSNIICGNSLIQNSRRFDGLNLNTLFPFLPEEGGFSHIIANPPYGLSRGEQIPRDELSALRSLYGNVISGKPNKYLLFMWRIVELLAPNGRFALLVPNSWLGIASATRLRKRLLERRVIHKIVICKSNAIKGRGVETVIVTGGQKPREKLEIKESGKTRFHLVGTLLQTKESSIPISWDTEIQDTWAVIAENSLPLCESGIGLVPRIALQVYRKGGGYPPQSDEVVKSHPFHSWTQERTSQHPYLEGRDVRRYGIKWSGRYLDYGPWVAEYQPISRYEGPRIVIREVLGKGQSLFQATYLEECFLYNRSILHIIPENSRPSSSIEEICLALLTILNSPFGSFVLRTGGRKSNRALFPKVLNADLKLFPIPMQFEANAQHLAAYARRLLKSDCPKSEAEVNRVILELYGISSHQALGMVA